MAAYFKRHLYVLRGAYYVIGQRCFERHILKWLQIHGSYVICNSWKTGDGGNKTSGRGEKDLMKWAKKNVYTLRESFKRVI